MKILKMKIHQSTQSFFPALFAILLAVTITSCDNESTKSSAGTGTMEVVMHDNPGNYQEVWVDVQRVEVNNQADEDTTKGWVVISEPDKRYNLLELINGSQEVLGEAELETGIYSQIRLILGDDNTIVVNDSTYNLQTPSAQQSGLKLNINADIKEGMTYTLMLDFDVSRSIVVRGQGGATNETYLLKPVIRAYAQAETGTISGIIEPAESEPWVYAIVDEDTVASTRAEVNTGEFKLLGLPSNTYLVSVESTTEDYDSQVISNVEVTAGENNNLGTITLDAIIINL